MARFTNTPLPGSKISSMTKKQIAGKKIVPVAVVNTLTKQKKYKSKIPHSIYGKSNKRMISMNFIVNSTLSTGSSPSGNVFTGQLSYRLNNVNVPYVGQAENGNLPQGYTQAAIAFTRFKVYAAKVKAEFYDPENADAVSVGMQTVGSADTYDLQSDNATDADQRKQTSVKTITADKHAYFNWYVKIPYVEGISSKTFASDLSYYDFPFNASASSALTDISGTTGDLMRKRVPLLHMALAPPPNYSNINAVSCKVRLNITYYVLCYGQVSLPTSRSTA